MWEGPSWVSAVDTTGDSPPTKWPRVTTPPNRRQSLITSDLDDSGLGVSFCSPPLSAKTNARVSPLKTPGSRSSAMSNSPYGRFRLSSFSSPTFSDRALRLSNCSNVIDVKFCEDRLEKNHGRVDIARLGSNSTAARTLELPTTTKSQTPSQKAESSLPVPSIFGAIETPSKCFPLFGDESGAFDTSFVFAEDSPLKRLVFDDSQPSTTMDSSQSSFVSNDFHSLSEFELDAKRSKSDDFAVFASPKKPMKTFSRRWLRIVTGTTNAQRDITVAAKAFLAQRNAMKAVQPGW